MGREIEYGDYQFPRGDKPRHLKSQDEIMAELMPRPEEEEYTEEFIRNKLLTSNQWLERGIVAIYNKQTRQEQASEETRERNGVGFNGADGHTGAYLAKWIASGKHLSGKWIPKARKMMVKYAGQLSKIANEG